MEDDEPHKLTGNRTRLPTAQIRPIPRETPLNSKYLTEQQLDQAQRMAGYGTPIRDIGVILGYSPYTFEDWYNRCNTIQHVIELGRAEALDRVRSMAYRKCVEGDSGMIKFYLQCRDGWKYQVEHINTIDATISVLSREIGKLSPQERIVQSDEIRQKMDILDASEVSDTKDFTIPVDEG